uniref:Uncharacterized protein n=1 Tax=Anopheles quadriannulatus TaxID=34691 RepID=A0A182XSZ8_ANOQN
MENKIEGVERTHQTDIHSRSIMFGNIHTRISTYLKNLNKTTQYNMGIVKRRYKTNKSSRAKIIHVKCLTLKNTKKIQFSDRPTSKGIGNRVKHTRSHMKTHSRRISS